MRYSKRYIVLTVILLVTFLAKLNTWNDEYADVTAFRGAKLQDEVFYPLKARSINEEGNLHLTVGEDTYGVADGIIMGDHMQVMASLPFVEDFFGCSASLYEDKKILLDYGDRSYTFYINSLDAKRDDKAITLDVMPELHEKQAYLSLQDLCREFGCTYSYDETNYQATISGDLQKEAFRHPMICGRKIVCPLCATRATLRPAGRRQHFLPWNPLFCRKKSFPLMQTL